jgi:uncharacterized membrane protein
VTGGPDIPGALAVIGVGIAAMGLGCKGFTPKGLPFSKTSNITGRPAEIIGAVCMVIGAAFVCFAIWGLSEGL